MFSSFTTTIEPSVQWFKVKYNAIYVCSICRTQHVYNSYYNTKLYKNLNLVVNYLSVVKLCLLQGV
jgi:hypothetical protein